MAQKDGGFVQASDSREFGRAKLSRVDSHFDLLKELELDSQVWMSHGDTIKKLPDHFDIIASTLSVEVAAIEHQVHLEIPQHDVRPPIHQIVAH